LSIDTGALKHLTYHWNRLHAKPLLSQHSEALAALASHWRDWLRPIEDWQSAATANERLGSLVRHLLCRYEVPQFMDRAWLAGRTALAFTWQSWFKLIGSGQNLRTAEDLPFPLSKKRAHQFLQAPPDMDIPEALRFAQVRDLGGDEALARSLLSTRLGTCFEDNDFWESVMRWFIAHPDLDANHHGPIIDYVHNQRFVPVERVEWRRGEEREVAALPAQPHLAMKGRTPASLLRAMERWHRQLIVSQQPLAIWRPSGLPAFTLDAAARLFSVTELLTSTDLEQEGQALEHCVASYVPVCLSGEFSIWSLAVDTRGAVQRLLTLQVHNPQRQIIEARGKHNRQPTFEEWFVLAQWEQAGGPRLPAHAEVPPLQVVNEPNGVEQVEQAAHGPGTLASTPFDSKHNVSECQNTQSQPAPSLAAIGSRPPR
jgi:hypothetical protein